MVDFKVSGQNVQVTLSCKNKEKLVKVYKTGHSKPGEPM